MTWYLVPQGPAATGRPGGFVTGPALEREERWRVCLRDIRGGDAHALTRLYDDTSSPLFGLALRILNNRADAEEVLLDVYDQVWRRADTYDASRGTVWRWLVLLTRSRALDRLRADAGRRERELPAAPEESEVLSQEPRPDERSIFREQQMMVRHALNLLPAEQRKAIEMAWFSEFTHVEIAASLGVPLGTIKTRIRAGMEKLRGVLVQPQFSAGETSR
jgi:RNA polymerase sigma-70 factor (ECF subfamily)